MSSASRCSRAPRPATSPTPSPRTPRRSASRATSSSPPTSRSRRSSRPASTARTSSKVARQLRRRQPPLHRALRRARLGVRERQPAPVLRRGLEDARLRGRRAARLAHARPRSSRRSPPARCTRRSPRASASGSSSASSTATLPAMHGAQAAGCSPVAQAWDAGHDVCRPVKPDTIAKSLAIGNPADGPYALELARRSGGSDRVGHRRRDAQRDPAARRDDRHLHRDRRRRHDREPREARRARRDRPRRDASCSSSPARA